MNLGPNSFLSDDVFDNFATIRDNSTLKCDVYEEDNKYIVVMDAPGFKKEEVKIETDNGYLTVTVNRNEERNEEDKTYIRRERFSKEYKRSFYIGEVEQDNIKAEFKDGILQITIFKKEPVETKKIIEIE